MKCRLCKKQNAKLNDDSVCEECASQLLDIQSAMVCANGNDPESILSAETPGLGR